MKKVTYIAHGLVQGGHIYFPPLKVEADNYDKLNTLMEIESRKCHYAINLVNSNDGYDFMNPIDEPWVKRLVMPMINWDIEKKIEEAEDA